MSLVKTLKRESLTFSCFPPYIFKQYFCQKTEHKLNRMEAKVSPESSRCIVCNTTTVPFSIGKHSLIQCPQCGLIASAHIPTDEERKKYYTNDYALVSESTVSKSIAEMRRWSRLPEQLKLLKDIHNVKKAPATILDIGCDKAYFLDEARRFGYDVTGVEPSETARLYTKNIGIPVVPDISDITDSYDIAVMWHSLEHSGNPLELLQRINTLLNDGGIIAIRVPDFGSLWSKILKERWIWFQPENHYYHFTQQSLHNLVQQAGFTPLFLHSQKPNNSLTLSSGGVALRSFSQYGELHNTFRLRISSAYQYLTGVELYTIAQKMP